MANKASEEEIPRDLVAPNGDNDDGGNDGGQSVVAPSTVRGRVDQHMVNLREKITAELFANRDDD